jgi:hypothetical protein
VATTETRKDGNGGLTVGRLGGVAVHAAEAVGAARPIGRRGVPRDRIAIALSLMVYAVFAATLGHGMHFPLTGDHPPSN